MTARTTTRLAWTIGLVSIAFMGSQLVLMFVDRHAVLPPDTGAQWTFANVLNITVNAVAVVIGIVLASRRPANPIGWLFLTAGGILSVSGFALAYALHAVVVDPGSLPFGLAFAWVGNGFGLSAVFVLPFLFLLFPTGHLLSPRWRPAAWVAAAAAVVVTGTVLAFATVNWRDPFDLQSSNNGSWVPFVLLVPFPLLLALGSSLAAVVVRYRRSVGDERLQLKWFVTGSVLVFVTFVGTFFSGNGGESQVWSVLQSLAFVSLFTAIGIAVLKYRLYDIDIVISRTVVYGALAVFITVVYLGLVVGVGTLVGNRRSPLLSAIAAAVIAVAFQPVRSRAGRLANRLVYGKRATPYEVLSDFADRMAGSYSLDEVLPRTARMLAEGTGAVRATVWLRVGDALRAEGSWPAPPEVAVMPLPVGTAEESTVARMVPVRYQDELLGALSVQKGPGDPVTSTDDKLLVDVASQAGLVLRNVRLIEELRASRHRLVTAQDEERRKLERNIHDGAQQQLVALAVKLNLAQMTAARDPAAIDPLLEQLKDDTRDALENLRDLARGIYPPLLADQGLTAALTAQAGKSAVPVRVDSNGIGRFSRDAEAAVYFCTLEALQNVAKYAQATRVDVRLHADDGRLVFEVQDDGVGFDTSATGYGTGLQGMADRLAALGGDLRVTSDVGEGTCIEGWVPADPAGVR
jgi:signal transduction histidine kinase